MPRKAAATTTLVGALSLLVGAFIASAAALVGKQRDDEEDFLVKGRRPMAWQRSRRAFGRSETV